MAVPNPARISRCPSSGICAQNADVVGTLAPTLLGASHLLFADRTGAAPEPEAVGKVVTAVIASIARDDIGR